MNQVIVNMILQSCSSCHNALNIQEKSLECCNQKFCIQCYRTHTLNEVNLSFDAVNPVMQKIHFEIVGLIAMEAKIIKEYNNWHKGIQIACKGINIDIEVLKQAKGKSQEYQNTWYQNCILPLKQSVDHLSQILNNMKNLG